MLSAVKTTSVPSDVFAGAAAVSRRSINVAVPAGTFHESDTVDPLTFADNVGAKSPSANTGTEDMHSIMRPRAMAVPK